LHNFEFPDLTLPLFKLHFKGLARQLSHTVKRAAPLTPVILNKIHQLLDLSDPLQVSMWAIMVSGFYLFARIGNLLPKSASNWDFSKQLSRCDVFVASDAIIFSLKWTKTIQTCERVLQVPLFSDPKNPLCPKQALLNMIKLSPGSPSDHLFSYSSPTGQKVITQYMFTKFLREKLKQCGIQFQDFSGHSMRRGGASCAFSSGVSSELIKSHGDWRSNSYLVYLEFSLQDRLETTKKMVS